MAEHDHLTSPNLGGLDKFASEPEKVYKEYLPNAAQIPSDLALARLIHRRPDVEAKAFAASAGDVVGPFEARLGNATYVVVVHVTEVRAAGHLTFEDVSDNIREILTNQKRERLVRRRS